MAKQIRWGRVFGAVSAVGLTGMAASWLLAAKPTVENQVWIERLPRDDRDRIVSLVLIAPKDSAERVGAVSVSSVWQRNIDVFRYGLVGKKARLVFPQDGHTAVVELKAYRCEGQAPAPLDLCLDITNARGQSDTLYSHADLHVRDLATQVDIPQDPTAPQTPSQLLELLAE